VKALCAALVFIAMAQAAQACSCARLSRDEVIASYAIVFEGRVVNIQTNGTQQTTTLSVVRAIKGVANGATIAVHSGTMSASCGYDFRNAPATMTVGGTADNGTITVRLCTMYNLNN
jgi:hypothetical protein